MHEFLHTLGLHHTHSRPDRDEYVEILTKNINPIFNYNFRKFNDSIINSYNLPYDFLSIMHYTGFEGGIDGAQTIRTIDPKNQNKIGQAGLSLGDVSLVKRMYGCPETITPALIELKQQEHQFNKDTLFKKIYTKLWLKKNIQLEIDEKAAQHGTCLYKGVQIFGYAEVWQDNCRLCSCKVEGGKHRADCTLTECLLEEELLESLEEGGGGGRKGIYGWKPRNYSEFWGVPLQHGVEGLLGTEEPTYQPGISRRNRRDLPEQYFSHEVPGFHQFLTSCQTHSVVPPAYPEELRWSGGHGWCASSWALAPTAAMADRCSL